ncbi:phage tail tape measure protein [Enterococcus thailandicus]|uniref:Phage tail tape measure protein n=2 Tax=Enterococcus thailandicus TaxID=417368 RepID=A0A179EW72_ENTTH|nr:phage tail tape measure protein [Enterococcus thailandicus]
MGGSAISKVMVNIQVAAKTGLGQMEELSAKTGMTRRELELMSSNNSKDFKALASSIGMTTSEMTGIMKASSNLENFGKIAGMSAQEFKKAFEEDAIGAIGKFVEGLGGAEAQGTSAIEMLDEMGIREVRLRDSLLRAGNASDLFKDAVSRSNKAFGENVALTDEANKRYETTESKLKMLKNEAVDAAIDLGGPFVDALRDGLEASKPLIKSLGSMAKSFSSLSEDQQKSIIKWIAVAAAAGPTLKLLGSGVSIIGKVTQSTGKLTGSLVELAAKAAEKKAMESFSATVATVGTTAAKTSGVGGIGGLTTALGKTAGVATTAAGSTGIGAVTTSLGLLGPALLGIVGVGGALALGYGAWKTFGEEAWNSSQRVKKWGADVGTEVDATLSTVKKKTEETSGQFNLMAQGFDQNTGPMVKNFETIGTSIESSLTKKVEGLDNLIKNLPGTVTDSMKEIVENEKEMNQSALDKIQENNERIKEIRENAAKANRDISISEAQMISNISKDTAEQYVNTLDLSAQQKKAILNSMTGDVSKASKEQAQTWLQSLGEQRYASEKHTAQMRKEQEKWLKEWGYKLDGEFAQTYLSEWDKINDATTQGFDSQIAAIVEKYPELAEEVHLATGVMMDEIVGANNDMIKDNQKLLDNAGYTAGKLAEIAKKKAETLKWDVDNASEASELWHSLVFDNKTGELKTNATEEVSKAMESESTWNQLRWLTKQADVNSNIKLMIAEAAIQNGKWNSLTFTDQQAMLDSNVTKTITQALQAKDDWNNLNFEQKKTIIYSNTPEAMAENLLNLGLWDKYQPEIKELNAKNYNFLQTLSKSEEKLKNWNGLPTYVKKILGDNYDFIEKIYSSEENYKRWNLIPDSEKRLLVDNTDFLTKITTSKETLGQWNELPAEQKSLLADNTDLLSKIFASKESFEAWKQMPDPVKRMLGNNEDILAKVKDGTISVREYNEKVFPLLKKILGDNSGLTSAVNVAGEAITNYNENFNPAEKAINAYTNAPERTTEIDRLNESWDKILRADSEKKLTIDADFIGPIQKNPYGHAKGTNFHPGGPAMVNDQKGPMYEELVQLPSGNSFIPKGRNVVLDLPRGSKVLKASRTKKLFSRYADGIGNISTVSTIPNFTPLVIAINELTAVLRQQTGVGVTTEESVAPKTSTPTDIQSITPEQLEEKTPEFALIGSEWLTNLSDGWNSVVPAYMSNEKLFINQYSTALKIQNTPNYLQGLAWNRNLMNGWNSLTGSFISAINSFCNQAMTTLRSYNSPMYSNGRAWQQNNLNGWNSLYGSFIARVNQLGNDSVNNLRSKSGGYYNAGSFLMQSLINGVNSMGSSLNATMNGVANKMVGGIGKGVNGVISGVNYVLKEVESSKSIGTWTVPQYAKGTEAHPGGLAMINDQKGPVHEEYVQMPDGKGFIAKGRDLLVNLPKGAQVLNASLTKKLKSRLDVPRYENGIGNFDIVDLLDDEKAMQKFLNSKVKYDGIGEPWLDMTKSGVKLMAQSANTMLQSKLSEFFTHGNFDGSMNGNGVYQYLVDVAQKVMSKFPGMTITSGYRPGDAYYHGKHQAIDIALPGVTGGSPIYTQAANYAFEKFPSKIAYVITNGKVRDRMGLSGTGASGNWVNWPDGDHFDHVHLNGSMGSGNIFNAGSGGGGVEKWRSLATKALKMENQYSTANLNALLYQMQTESNGDPRAINLWDDNAKRGTPSKGLMQVIDPTFRSNARTGFDKDIFDPISNILAAIRYTKSTYGSLLAGWRGVGYANGGLINKDGLYRAGEGNKPEMVVPLTRKTRAIELIGEALAFLSGNKNGSTKDSVKSDNSEELLLLIKQQQRQHNELMMILKAILGKDSGIKKSDIGKAANDFLGSDLSKLQYMAGR